MRQLGNLLKNESSSQEDSLNAKLAARKKNKKSAKDELMNKIQDKADRLN